MSEKEKTKEEEQFEKEFEEFEAGRKIGAKIAVSLLYQNN